MSKFDFVTNPGEGIAKTIPCNLEECFILLGKIDKENIKLFKNTKEEELMGLFHHSFGQWLRNAWGLWNTEETQAGSKLRKYFKELGIWHADDMSGIIIDSWHRHLNNKPLKLEEQIKVYQKYWKKQGQVKEIV